METARLIDSLHLRLADLEHKVQAYRHDLALEFEQYRSQILHDATPDVASNVERALALSKSKYPLLGPEIAHAVEVESKAASTESRALVTAANTTTNNHIITAATTSSAGSAAFLSPKSTPPSAVFGAAPESAPEPPAVVVQQRERELRGLFTPSYLPLLDCSPPRSTARPSYPPPAPSSPGPALQPRPHQPHAQPSDQGPPQGSPGTMVAELAAAQAQAPDAPFSSPQLPDRLNHVRHATGDTSTTASSSSDKTEPRPRPRSALRRSSSPSKTPQSPRRVRFDFMGAEVLPTASPETSHFATHQSQADPQDGADASDAMQVDSEEIEYLPPPRKISSSEALRALSRTPLDENTIWTVVGPSDGQGVSSTSKSTTSQAAATANSPSADGANTRATTQPTTTPISMVKQTTIPASPQRNKVSKNDSDDDSDEDFLTIGRSRSPRVPAAKTAPPSESLSATANGPALIAPLAASSLPVEGSDLDEKKDQATDNSMDEDDDDIEFFHFESVDGGLTPPPKPRQKPSQPEPEDDDQEDTKDEQDEPMTGTSDIPKTTYGTSPAVAITNQRASPTAPSPTAAKFHIGSVGSYKGRPLVMPVVKNAEVHAQAASLGDFTTFVGGLDGRSGADAGDLNSFRASLVQSGFSGTPRSLTERMMMEEAASQRKRQ